MPVLSLAHGIEPNRTKFPQKADNRSRSHSLDHDPARNRTAKCREFLRTALALTDDLISQAKLPAAAILGRKGGSVTAKRGSAYFRKLAARRKTHGGGRPRKESN